MGFLDTMIMLAALGGGLYYFTYYVMPYMSQMGYGGYAPQQPQTIYVQAPAPAPAPEPEPEPAPESEDVLQLPEGGSEIENEAENVQDELAAEGEEEEEGNGDEEESEYERVKRTTKEFQESTDPKKDTRSKAELARAQKAAGFQTFLTAGISRPYKVKGYYLDRFGRLRYYY